MMMRNQEGFSVGLLLALVCSLSSFAEPDLKLNLEPCFGLLFGEAHEIVYSGSYVVSELVWPMVPIAFGGAKLDMKSGSGFMARLDIKAGLPGHFGTITDSDYLNGDGIKTHFSAHDCYTERAILLDAKVGWAFPIDPQLEASLMVAFSFMDLKWSAKDGYLQYPPETSAPYTPWSSSTPKTAAYGTGIIYEQIYFIPGVFLGTDWLISRFARLHAGFLYSPAVACNDVDNHEFTGADYYEKMSGGSLVEPSLQLEWNPTPQSTLSFVISYRSIWGLVGNATVIYTTSSPYLSGHSPGATYTFPDGGGASYSALELSITYSARL